jgi:hypothetical protein
LQTPKLPYKPAFDETQRADDEYFGLDASLFEGMDLTEPDQDIHAPPTPYISTVKQ